MRIDIDDKVKHRPLAKALTEILMWCPVFMASLFVSGEAFFGYPHVMALVAENVAAGAYEPVPEFFVTAFPVVWFCGGIMLSGGVLLGGMAMIKRMMQ